MDMLQKQRFPLWVWEISNPQFADRHNPRAILVATRQMEKHVLDRFNTDSSQSGRRLGPDTAQSGDRESIQSGLVDAQIT